MLVLCKLSSNRAWQIMWLALAIATLSADANFYLKELFRFKMPEMHSIIYQVR